MSAIQATTKLQPTVRAHAVMRDGRQVLIEASGPGVSLMERKIATWNHKRWNEGKRTWLL